MSAGTEVIVPVADIASARILRMSVGVALALAFSQAVNWPAAFIAPVLASVILSLPLPVPSSAAGVRFVVVLGAAVSSGLLLLPVLHNQPAAGVCIVILAMFSCFLYGARGGSPVLAMFLLVGVTVVPVIGSETIDGALVVTAGIGVGAGVAVIFVWIAFALFPDPPTIASPTAPPAAPPDPVAAARNALRSTLIVAPVFLWLLATSQTAAYAVVLIKVASMGQQAGLDQTRTAGRNLLLSTLVGGSAAIVIWNVLQIWPALVMYTLLCLLAGLVIGRRIFAGVGLSPTGPMWSYGFLTLLIVIAPAVQDGAGGSAAGARFTDRLLMFLLTTLYAVAAVTVFDHLWPRKASPPEPVR
jgi:uncharacterized membrane protein YccC